MRFPTVISAVVMLCLLGFSESRSREEKSSAVTIKIVDDAGRELAGLVRIEDADGNRVDCPELLPRGLGLKQPKIERWFVLPKATAVKLPHKPVSITAIAGLETEQAAVKVDLSSKPTASVTLRLTRFYDAAAKGLRSGNTHLHLQKISRQQSDQYLKQVPQADGLDLLFVSYLERAGADREYTTNRYSKAEIEALGQGSEVVYGNGEEHRHNFAGFGQGFGHVMLLDIQRLILPVSIGPGIMKTGTDTVPLQRGINTARRDKATIVWCHNNWGLEALPNFLLGRIDALNIFDGGAHGSFKDSFYNYLNAGVRVPFSTGTDWFMYDFSRVYVRMNGRPTVQTWLKGLAEGRSFISNGPLLEFHVNEGQPGDTLKLDKARALSIEARVVGRIDFQRLEVVRNGRVVASAQSRAVKDHFEAHLSESVACDGPGWLALRTPPPPVKNDPQLQQPVPENEFGRELFAHSSPVYVEVGGKKHFDRETAKTLLATMKANRTIIAKQGNFADAQDRARILDVHEAGIEFLAKRLGF